MRTTIRKLIALSAAGLAVPAVGQSSSRGLVPDVERQRSPAILAEYTSPPIARVSMNSHFGDAPLESEDRGTGRSVAQPVKLASHGLTDGRESGSGAQRSATVEPSSESGRRKATLEEVIVTAQKRSERLQDVPISVSVLGGEQLDSSTVKDVTEALGRVPGVAISESYLGGFSQVPIRGVATQLPFDTGSSPTAYYLDSVPFGFANDAVTPDPDAYDLERVEVLRGPQGTLYGANALNGVVRVITRDANPDSLEFKARALTSSTEGGGENYRGDAAINVPIIEGKLGARAVVGYQSLSGWIDRPNEKDANDAERHQMRMKVQAQPTDALSISLSGWLSRADYGAPSTGADDRNTKLGDEEIATDYDAYGLKIGYDFSRMSFTSTTGYLEYENDYRLRLGAAAQAPVIDGTLASRTVAQEVYLASKDLKAWRWSAGAMYRDSSDRDVAYLTAFFEAPNIVRNISKSYAVFGELTRLFADGHWELTAGLRYFEDELEQFEDASWIFGLEESQLIDSKATFDATSPRLVLTWNPSERTTAYVSYSEGFRSGYHQLPFVLTVGPFPPVAPDGLTNYEIGAKNSFFEGRLNAELAIYYIDWQDIQQNTRVLISEDVGQVVGINGDSASGLGVDVGLTAAIDALQLGVSFSWNDLSMDSDVYAGDELLLGKGDRPNNSAEYTVGASVEYAMPLGRAGFEGTFSASANYTSELIARDGVPVEVSVGDSLLIGRAGFALHSPEHWVATLFVDNVNNERGSPVRVGGPNSAVRIRPRTFGVQLEYSF